MTAADLSLPHIHRAGDAGAPALLLLHGTGGSPQDLVDLAGYLSPSSTVLAPAGPVSEGGAARWFRRLAEGVFDEDDVVARTEQLAGFVAEARQHYELHGRLVAVGFSNGANIAASTVLSRPDVLDEAILFAAMLPLTDPPERDLGGSRVFLSNGERDPMAPVNSVDRLTDAFGARGASVANHRHAGGHEVTREGVDRAAAWLVGAPRG